MEILRQFLIQTPLWVWILLGYLIWRGVKARQPAETSLAKLAVIPVLFTVWGLYDLVRLYGLGIGSLAIWAAGIAVGTLIGLRLLDRQGMRADAAHKVIHRPADFTLLPLLLLTFAVKYVFGVVAATSPDLLQQTAFRIADLGLSGLFTGIFVGKFLCYASVQRAAT